MSQILCLVLSRISGWKISLKKVYFYFSSTTLFWKQNKHESTLISDAVRETQVAIDCQKSFSFLEFLRNWLFHSIIAIIWLFLIKLIVCSDGSNNISSNIKQTRTSNKLKHVYLLLIHLEHLNFGLNKWTSNIKTKWPSIDLLNYSSNRLEHHFFNIEQTQMCSSVDNWTLTPYSWLRMIEHWT